MDIIKATTGGTITEFDIVSSIARTSIASGGTVKDCLGILVEIGFVDYDLVRRTYKTTDHGKTFAAVFDELSAAYQEEEEQRNITSFCRKRYV